MKGKIRTFRQVLNVLRGYFIVLQKEGKEGRVVQKERTYVSHTLNYHN